MTFNESYLNLHYSLIEIFLIDADKNILDITYLPDAPKLAIQIILLEGAGQPTEKLERLHATLTDFDITVTTLFVTKEQFNVMEGDWLPSGYTWLNYLLFSKAKIV